MNKEIKNSPSLNDYVDTLDTIDVVSHRLIQDIVQSTGQTPAEVRAGLTFTGNAMLDALETAVSEHYPNNPEAANSLMLLTLIGLGWSSLTTASDLSEQVCTLITKLSARNGKPLGDE